MAWNKIAMVEIELNAEERTGFAMTVAAVETLVDVAENLPAA
jgi:hypothetical protein